jgi:hypothetical protein
VTLRYGRSNGCILSLAAVLLGVVNSGSAAWAGAVADGKGDLAVVPLKESYGVAIEYTGQPKMMDLPDLSGSVLRTERIVPTSALLDDTGNWLRRNLEKADFSDTSGYDANRFWDQTRAVGWDVAIVWGLTTYFGFKNWEWGTSGFTLTSEGWFGEDTKYGGIDKLGHAYTGYLLTEYFSNRVAHTADDPRGAIITGAILGMSTQMLVEIFDGFSGGYGASYEDVIANGVGVGFSVVENLVPGLDEKIDFRLEYIQSDYSSFQPVTDYAGQKYVLALKLSGFEELEDTPLRFVELQAGYFTRGFTDPEIEAGVEKRREPYVAIGLNLNELLGEVNGAKETLPGLALSRALEYVQVPYTYLPTVNE